MPECNQLFLSTGNFKIIVSFIVMIIRIELFVSIIGTNFACIPNIFYVDCTRSTFCSSPRRLSELYQLPKANTNCCKSNTRGNEWCNGKLQLPMWINSITEYSTDRKVSSICKLWSLEFEQSHSTYIMHHFTSNQMALLDFLTCYWADLQLQTRHRMWNLYGRFNKVIAVLADVRFTMYLAFYCKALVNQMCFHNIKLNKGDGFQTIIWKIWYECKMPTIWVSCLTAAPTYWRGLALRVSLMPFWNKLLRNVAGQLWPTPLKFLCC